MVACVGDLLLKGSSSRESVLSIWTEANGTSMQGLISLGLLVNNSTISEADGRLVGVGLQQLRSKDPLKQNLSSNSRLKHFQVQVHENSAQAGSRSNNYEAAEVGELRLCNLYFA